MFSSKESLVSSVFLRVNGCRPSVAQVFVDMIRNLFGNLRTMLGLPAVPTDSTTDPLAILESAIENMVNTSVGQ